MNKMNLRRLIFHVKTYIHAIAKHFIMRTRPDTRPIPVADGWAGAEMPVFPLFNSMTPDERKDGRTDGLTDGRSLL